MTTLIEEKYDDYPVYSAHCCSSRYARRSKRRHDESSDPVPTALPLGKKSTALMSDSCPVNVLTQLGEDTSQSLAVASHAPETNSLDCTGSGTQSVWVRGSDARWTKAYRRCGRVAVGARY